MQRKPHHTSFCTMNAFPMCLCTEVMLDSLQAIIFIDVIYCPTELIDIIALVASIACYNVDVCFWVFVEESGTDLEVKFCKLAASTNIVCDLKKSKQCVIYSLDLNMVSTTNLTIPLINWEIKQCEEVKVECRN